LSRYSIKEVRVMVKEKEFIAFGPVPSRRLGQSLGINNIPPKTCTYSCVYCQVGRTHQLLNSRRSFYSPETIFKQVEKKVSKAKLRGELIDYLTFVSDGEPTLDINIGVEIELLKSLGIKIAVITNASLLWKEELRRDLYNTDLVSIKIDTVSEEAWRKINRPHGSMQLDKILNGILDFSNEYKGELITESMFIKSTLFKPEKIEKTADFISKVNPNTCYLAVPTRPPAEKWVKSPTDLELFSAYILFEEKNINVEYLIGSEGNSFAFTGNVEEDLLSITSVHPMREEAVREYIKKAGKNWKAVETLILEGKLKEAVYERNKFFVRDLSTVTV
jgi:wyosine [tRNA(Phe)-imidazoG37] synthetase (radical SAM superfamily)